jgi:hypothetical protein
MRRLLAAVGVIAALAVAGVLAAGVGARTVSGGPALAAAAAAARNRLRTVSAHSAPAAARSQRRFSTAPHRNPPVDGGHACFVSVPRCSETPCIEYIQSATAAVARVPAPGVRPAAPRCGSTKLGAKIMRTPTAPPNFSLALPALAHRLQARPAGLP